MSEIIEEKTLVSNRRAEHEYFITSTIEAGIVLKGTEIKSLRNGKANFVDSYVDIIDDEVYLKNMHISPYEHGNINNHEEKRNRKLLLKKNEIRKLKIKIKERGYTLIPLRAYLLKGKVKIEIAVAKGKKYHDRRDSIAERDAKREIDRRIKYN